MEPVDPPPPVSKPEQAVRMLTKKFMLPRPDAEDLAQQTLIDVCVSKRHGLADDLRAYYWRSVENAAKNFLRSPARRSCPIDEYGIIPPCPRENAEDQLISAERHAIVGWAMCRLTADERALLEVCASKSLTEVAAHIGMSKSTAKRLCDDLFDRVRDHISERCGPG